MSWDREILYAIHCLFSMWAQSCMSWVDAYKKSPLIYLITKSVVGLVQGQMVILINGHSRSRIFVPWVWVRQQRIRSMRPGWDFIINTIPAARYSRLVDQQRTMTSVLVDSSTVPARPSCLILSQTVWKYILHPNYRMNLFRKTLNIPKPHLWYLVT